MVTVDLVVLNVVLNVVVVLLEVDVDLVVFHVVPKVVVVLLVVLKYVVHEVVVAFAVETV